MYSLCVWSWVLVFQVFGACFSASLQTHDSLPKNELERKATFSISASHSLGQAAAAKMTTYGRRGSAHASLHPWSNLRPFNILICHKDCCWLASAWQKALGLRAGCHLRDGAQAQPAGEVQPGAGAQDHQGRGEGLRGMHSNPTPLPRLLYSRHLHSTLQRAASGFQGAVKASSCASPAWVFRDEAVRPQQRHGTGPSPEMQPKPGRHRDLHLHRAQLACRGMPALPAAYQGSRASDRWSRLRNRPGWGCMCMVTNVQSH